MIEEKKTEEKKVVEKKIRTDKLKNKAKIIKEVLKNPLQSQREIAENTWLWKTTVQEHLLDIKATKDDRILWVCEKDFEIVKLWQAIIEERLRDKTETDKMRTFEIAQTIEKSEKRYMLFKWDATDKDWWMKQPDVIFQIIQPNEWENNSSETE